MKVRAILFGLLFGLFALTAVHFVKTFDGPIPLCPPSHPNCQLNGN